MIKQMVVCNKCGKDIGRPFRLDMDQQYYAVTISDFLIRVDDEHEATKAVEDAHFCSEECLKLSISEYSSMLLRDILSTVDLAINYHNRNVIQKEEENQDEVWDSSSSASIE